MRVRERCFGVRSDYAIKRNGFKLIDTSPPNDLGVRIELEVLFTLHLSNP
jgi:hypothetical protein